jgi:hypothetical protein
VRLALALLLAGCATAPQYVSLAPPQAAVGMKQYVGEMEKFTRRGDSIFDFDTTLIVYATFHAPEFQDAFIAKYLDVYHVNANAQESVRGSLLESVAEGWVFHVETQSHTYELNELKPPKSVWRTTLVDDKGREVSPLGITNDNTRPEVLQAFYPYTNVFAHAWRIVFPKNLPDGSPLVTPDTKSLTMRIAGPPGHIELTWKMQP